MFEALCRKQFDFLISNYGFKVVRVEAEPFGCYITFSNKVTGVRVSFEPKDGGIFILLYRLINGEIPPYEVFIKPETVINSFYLDDILALRSASTTLELDFTDKPNPTSEELESVLVVYANALQAHAQDVLQGDFSVFPKLEKIVKQRAKV